ncbi:MAG: hypothetical protein GTO63_34355, partial [Anaerolineae bacterium]|nr:hypothetical protein [Anaerolineae bacterium]NIN99730.1 hypothetical protein [Anaerolineae bacterium]
AEAARRRAEERLRTHSRENLDFARAEAALRRAVSRIKVTELSPRRGGLRRPLLIGNGDDAHAPWPGDQGKDLPSV